MESTFIIAEKAPNLPSTPWRFALHFYQKIQIALAAIFVFEAAQASCTIMLPYAVKQIIDAVTLANKTGADIFDASYDAMVFFALLNLGVVIFSRASGAVLVSNGPVLRARIRKSLYRINLKGWPMLTVNCPLLRENPCYPQR